MSTKSNHGPLRKLTTIFAADVAEYSRHMSESEDSALFQLRELRKIMDRIIENHGGRIANTAGDSVIAEFDSPTESVRAAIQIQHQHKQHNEGVPKENRLLFRIGINIGDVLHQKGGDLLGNGVNIAARLESIAQPGGICVSENVYNQIAGAIDSNLTTIGEHFVKNIDKPIRVYAVGDSGGTFSRRIKRLHSNVGRNPTTIIAILLLASATLLIGIWSIYTAPDFNVVDAEYIENLNKKSKQEILESFDLVTEGDFQGSKYYVIRTFYKKFEDLNEIAKALGGNLVSINSEEENSFVYNLSLKEPGHWRQGEPDNSFYGPLIGLVQAEDAREPNEGWSWVNGDPLIYSNWIDWGPDNAGADADVAAFWGRGRPSPKWYDLSDPQWSIIVEINPTR